MSRFIQAKVIESVFYDLTEKDRARVEKLHNEKLRQQSKYPPGIEQSTCEVGLLAYYGRELAVTDVEQRPQSLQVIPRDTGGRRLRVSQRESWPFTVYSYRLDVDLYVFVRSLWGGNRIEMLGWLPRLSVEEAPYRWYEDEEGERTGYGHMIDRDFLYPMPDEFDFSFHCDHPAGIWDRLSEAWLCFWCDRLVYDSVRREAPPIPDRRDGDPPQEGEGGA